MTDPSTALIPEPLSSLQIELKRRLAPIRPPDPDPEITPVQAWAASARERFDEARAALKAHFAKEMDELRSVQKPQVQSPETLTKPIEPNSVSLLTRLRFENEHSQSFVDEILKPMLVSARASSQKQDKPKQPKKLRFDRPAPRTDHLRLPEVCAKRSQTNTRRSLETEERHKQERKTQIAKEKANGGRYSTHYSGRYGRHIHVLLTADGLARKQHAARKVAAQRLSRNSFLGRPATYGLSLDLNGFRSPAEALTQRFIAQQLLPVSLRYAETECRGYSSEQCITWHGYRTRWERDFDLDVDGEAYQIQVKGTGFLYKQLHKSIRNKYEGLDEQKLRSFRKLRTTLLNFAIRDITNKLSCQRVKPEHEIVRPILCGSHKSVKQWIKDELICKDETALLRLYKKESKRVHDYWWKILAAAFPDEFRVLLRALDLFNDPLTCPTPEYEFASDWDWSSGLVAHVFGKCLQQAKADYNFDDSDGAIRHRWRKLPDKAKKLAVPRRFVATTTKGLL